MNGADTARLRNLLRARGTSALLERFWRMAFMPDSTRTDRRDLILARAEASRRRRLEEARIRDAQAMVAQFFGLNERVRERPRHDRAA